MCEDIEVYWSRISRQIEEIRKKRDESQLVSLSIEFDSHSCYPPYHITVKVTGYIEGVGHTETVESRPDQTESLIGYALSRLKSLADKPLKS